jgi:hypothetical protein
VTLLIAHRRNQPEELATTPAQYGIEMDIRSYGDRLVVTHEPFDPGVDLETWLDSYAHAFLVANVKEEGLEQRVEAALAARGIEEWTYLDQSFPFMVKTLRRGERRCAVRVSEYESVKTALALETRPQWVWLDSFTGAWPPPRDLVALAAAGYRIMIVSPELQARDPEPEVDGILRRLSKAGLELDAVCTKRPELWG